MFKEHAFPAGGALSGSGSILHEPRGHGGYPQQVQSALLGSSIFWHKLTIGQHRLACPKCGRGARDRTLGVTLDHQGGVAHCFRCNFVEVQRHERGIHGFVLAPAQKVESKLQVLSQTGRKLWSNCEPVSGIARAYLEARGCIIPPQDGGLRWHPALRHPGGYVGPALVGLVTDAVTGEPMSLHRTWINANGEKAQLDPPRLLLGGHRKQGGVIRLWPDEAVTTSLAVTEGIETGLSLAHAHQPVWALLDAGNLGQLPVLPGIECLVIGADHDDAGIKAAKQCADQWARAGCEVRLVIPAQPGLDFNDMAQEAA